MKCPKCDHEMEFQPKDRDVGIFCALFVCNSEGCEDVAVEPEPPPDTTEYFGDDND